MDIRGIPWHVPRLMALPRKMTWLWPRHVPRFCSWKTPSYQSWQPTEARGNCHGTFRRNCGGNFHGYPRSLPRQHGNIHGISAAIASAVSEDVQPKQFARPSVTVRGDFHGNPPIRGDYHGSPRQLPQHMPRFCLWQTASYQPRPRKSATMATRKRPWHGSPYGLGLWFRVRSMFSKST